MEIVDQNAFSHMVVEDESETTTAPTIEKRTSVRLDQEWVQVLINLRMKYAKLFSQSHNSATEAWKLIFKELQDTGAPSNITLPKIKKKWMNLMTRYRQIKNSPMIHDHITWPYYEQINRAFGKNFPLSKEVEDEDKATKEESCSFLNNIYDNERKKDFILNLIEMRYHHRHFFTGKKYAAREGWFHIQLLLNCKETYTVEQLSKCWQNLIQRYKQLKKSDKPISWPYFQQIHSFFATDSSAIDEMESVNNLDQCKSEESLLMDADVIIEEDNSSPTNKPPAKKNIRPRRCDCLQEIKSQIREILQNQTSQYKEIIEILKNIQSPNFKNEALNQ